LLVVCCVAGCGGSDKSLKNLSYSELTALHSIEYKKFEAAEPGSDEHFIVLQRVILINELRKKAWETESKNSGVQVESVDQLKAEYTKNVQDTKKALGLPTTQNP
jgi:hypothetical protein